MLATGSVAVHAAWFASVIGAPAPVTAMPAAAPARPLNVVLVTSAKPPLPGAIGRPAVTAMPLMLPAPASPETLLEIVAATSVAERSGHAAYLPSNMLERRATPVSEPDIAELQGVTTSGLPVRLRIFINRFGQVVEVEAFEVGPLDDDFSIALREMFLRTAFLPGRRDGVDVASYLDIELAGK